MENEKLTWSQEIWLNQRGGRNENHVNKDEKGLFILMFTPKLKTRAEKIYLPE